METDSQGDEWNKKFLESLLDSNSDRLVIKANRKGKNPFIWSKFQIAYIDGIEQKYACCNFCKTFIKYSGRTGTGGLMRHLCFRNSNSVKHPKRRKTKAESVDESDDIKFGKNTWARLRLEGLLHRNSSRIGYVSNSKGKSNIWSRFRILTVDNIRSKFACCMACRSIVTYTSRTGTGSMMRHKCNTSRKRLVVSDLDGSGMVDQDAVSDQVDVVGVEIKSEALDWDYKDDEDQRNSNRMSWMSPEVVDDDCKTTIDEPDGRVPFEVERMLQQKHIALVNKSLRLFDVFENQEFLEFAQFLVNLGARYGPIDVKDVFKKK